MKSFPWNAIVEGFDDDTGFPIYDRQYDADDFRDVLSRFFSNGIFSDEPIGFSVKAGSGMSVSIEGGTCFINGTTGIEKESTTLMVKESDPTNPRIDSVVLQWNADLDIRNIDLKIIHGEPSQTPVRPALKRIKDDVWELGICDILIPAGSVTVADTRITDTRLESERCGIVTPFAEFDSTSFFKRIQAIVDKFEEGLPIISKEQIDAVVADENPESDSDVLSLTGMSYWWKFIKEAAGDKIDTISEQEVIDAFTGEEGGDVLTLIEQVSKLNNRLDKLEVDWSSANQFIMTAAVSVQKQIAANSSDTLTLTTTIPDGYKPIGVCRLSTGNAYVVPYYWEFSNEGIVTMNVRNLSTSSAVTGTFSAKLMCVKSGLKG